MLRPRIAFVVFACLIGGCTASETATDDGGSSHCTGAQEAIADDVEGLTATYLGMISDDGGEVRCRFDDATFELQLSLDPESACAASEFCPSGAFSCALSGTLELDGVPAGSIAGHALRSTGTSVGLHVELSSTAIDDSGLDVPHLVYADGAPQSRKLGGEGARHAWFFTASDGGEEPDATERCAFTIESYR